MIITVRRINMLLQTISCRRKVFTRSYYAHKLCLKALISFVICRTSCRFLLSRYSITILSKSISTSHCEPVGNKLRHYCKITIKLWVGNNLTKQRKGLPNHRFLFWLLKTESLRRIKRKKESKGPLNAVFERNCYFSVYLLIAQQPGSVTRQRNIIQILNFSW